MRAKTLDVEDSPSTSQSLGMDGKAPTRLWYDLRVARWLSPATFNPSNVLSMESTDPLARCQLLPDMLAWDASLAALLEIMVRLYKTHGVGAFEKATILPTHAEERASSRATSAFGASGSSMIPVW